MNKFILNMKNKKNKKWAPFDNAEQIDSIKDNIGSIRS